MAGNHNTQHTTVVSNSILYELRHRQLRFTVQTTVREAAPRSISIAPYINIPVLTSKACRHDTTNHYHQGPTEPLRETVVDVVPTAAATRAMATTSASAPPTHVKSNF